MTGQKHERVLRGLGHATRLSFGSKPALTLLTGRLGLPNDLDSWTFGPTNIRFISEYRES